MNNVFIDTNTNIHMHNIGAILFHIKYGSVHGCLNRLGASLNILIPIYFIMRVLYMVFAKYFDIAFYHTHVLATFNFIVSSGICKCHRSSYFNSSNGIQYWIYSILCCLFTTKYIVNCRQKTRHPANWFYVMNGGMALEGEEDSAVPANNLPITYPNQPKWCVWYWN